MVTKSATIRIPAYRLKKEGVRFYIDKKSRVYWSIKGQSEKPLAELPWEYQQPFYFQFLHNSSLAERFKDMEILGAIDVFIKSQFLLKSLWNPVPKLL